MGGSTAAFHIPTIDIAPYLEDPTSEAADQIIQDVRNACMAVGFFSLVGHSISRKVQDDIFDAAKKLFSLPIEEKRALRHPLLKNRGYEIIGGQALQVDTLPDLKEVSQYLQSMRDPMLIKAWSQYTQGFYIGQHIPAHSPAAQAHPHLLGENIFPASLSPSEFQDPTKTYYNAVVDLSLTVLEILAKGLPYGDGIFREFASNDPVCIMRLLHYPPQVSQDERQLGAGAHTDFGTCHRLILHFNPWAPKTDQGGMVPTGAITLLLQDSSGGLEVLNESTGTWHAVAPNPDAYVVNIGDMLSMWTKGIYKSAMHRVINKSGGDRYSIPFFFDGNAEVKLSPFDGSEPVGGRVITVEEHMLERLGTSYGRVDQNPGVPVSASA